MEQLLLDTELIDTQWDVNELVRGDFTAASEELIDTQWDVNFYHFCDFNDFDSELIDTQWDVNYIKEICIAGSVIRINRYIVGCK